MYWAKRRDIAVRVMKINTDVLFEMQKYHFTKNKENVEIQT